LYPARVQGDGSAAEIVAALGYFSKQRLVDVILLVRGGGSLEDLWSFNEESVARAIVASVIPVISGVGHETDFTIADFVADLRAPTPSAAAELITEEQHRVGEHLSRLEARLHRAAHFRVLQARQQLMHMPIARAESRVTLLLRRLEQRMDDANLRMEGNLNFQLRERQRHVAQLGATVLRHDPRQHLAHARQHFASAGLRMEHALMRAVHEQRVRWGAFDARLRSLSPLAVLDRGYALVQDADGALVRSVKQVSDGAMLTTRISDGAFTSRVESAGAKKRSRKRES
jgi:exodeoxyribonuclease VII large subunit